MALSFLLISSAHSQDGESLLKKRAKHVTQIVTKKTGDKEMSEPPAEQFHIVKYPGKLGEMAAYLSKPENSEKTYPAIIWLTGGFPTSSPQSYLWEETDAQNEQSARIYRYSGVITMYPHLRGGSKGMPGHQEAFYGEVEDVISAYNFLAKQKNVDPKRIYLGGHSTGGTLALLVAASTNVFAGVISLGPTHDDYGEESALYEWNKKERELRAPIQHLSSIKSPTWVVEGIEGNSDSIRQMKAKTKNPNLNFVVADVANHFQIIHPVNALFAKAIVASKDGRLKIENKTLKESYINRERKLREIRDLEILADLRGSDIDFSKPQLTVHTFYSSEAPAIENLKKIAKKSGFTAQAISEEKGDDGSTYYKLNLEKVLNLMQLDKVFEATSQMTQIANDNNLYYSSWGVN